MKTATIVSLAAAVVLAVIAGYFYYEQKHKPNQAAAMRKAAASEAKESADCADCKQNSCVTHTGIGSCESCADHYPSWRIAQGPLTLNAETSNVPWDQGSCDRVAWDLQRQADFYAATCNGTCY